MHDLALNSLMKILLSEYFLSVRCVFFITDKTNSQVLENIPLQIVNIAIVNRTLCSKFVLGDFGCKDVIIATQRSVSIFKQFEDIIRNESNYIERYDRRRYIIIDHKNSEENISDIFKLPELKYVADLLVIKSYTNDENPSTYKYNINSYLERTVFRFSTHRFGGTRESYMEEVFLDKWFSGNGSFLLNKNLFPDKISNLQGRAVKLVSFMYEPYSVYDQEKGIYDGIETMFCVEYASRHNGTPRYITVGDEYWGYINNWSGTGVLGSLVEDKADIGFAALYRWTENYPYLDFSKSLIRGGVRLYVPAPKLAAGWFLPTYSFTPEVWGAAVFTFFFSSLFLWFISLVYNYYREGLERSQNGGYWNHYITTIFTLIRIFLEQPYSLMYEEGVYKLFTLFIIIQTLLLSFFYNSGFASIMTIPRYEGIIRTIEDFANSELEWGAPSDAWLKSLENAQEEKYKIIVNRYVVASNEELINLGKKQALAYPLERLQYGHFAILEYHTRDMIPNYRITFEDLNWDFCIYMLRKNSVFLPSLNELIIRVYESGIIAFWENKIVSQYMDVNQQNSINYYYLHHDNEYPIVQLSWEHIQGAFGILTIGYTFSVLSFLSEKMFYKYHHPTDLD